MNLRDNTFLQGGKYKIVRFINSGGFGCTYEAEHVMLEKRVAIKEFFVKDFCNRDETTSNVSVGITSKRGLVAKLRRKFVDEAKALCRLEHRGIVRVSDVFEENGTAYFVMDFVEGRSLSEIVKEQKRLPEARALKYIRQIAEALRYVHGNNRLHLDVKPGNIMIDRNDNAVLIDFGASKQYDEQDGENTSTLLGKTPGYAPLEQMGNDVVKFTPATDIYALGATLYKALSGVTPLSANLLASGEGLAPLPASISMFTRRAISKSMEINKTKRPQSIDEFLAILDERVTVDDEATELSGDESTTGIDFHDEQEQSYVNDESSEEEQKNKKIIKHYGVIAISAIVCAIAVYFMIPKEPSTPDPVDVVKEVTSQSFTNAKGDTFVYTGEVDSIGAPSGNGKGVYNEGTYVGEYIGGIRQGKGVYDTTDGSNHFEGTFENDSYSEGRLKFDDGSYYEGTFKNETFYTGKFYKKDGTFDFEMRNGK